MTFEKYPELQRRIFDLFPLSTGPDTAVERISALLCCLPSVPAPAVEPEAARMLIHFYSMGLRYGSCNCDPLRPDPDPARRLRAHIRRL